MKLLKNKKYLILILLFTLTNCGFGNNVLLIGYNFTAIGPHKHRVTKEIEESFPKNGMSIVSLNFKVNKKDGTNTVWRKMNQDGTFSKRITLTYIEAFKRGRVRVALEPGIYVMDGIRYPDPKNKTYLNVGAFNKFYSKEQMGWNEKKKKPLWFSFNAKEGEIMTIPDIAVSYTCKSGHHICRGDNLKLNFKVGTVSKSKVTNYEVGYKINHK